MKIHNTLRHLKRSSPTILTSLGVIGTVATTIMAVKATPKAIRILEAAEKEKGEPLSSKEKAIKAASFYVPALITGTCAIACIFGANVLNKRAQASLASSYALLDNFHKAYRGKLIELKGKDTDVEIMNQMMREQCDVRLIDLDTPDKEVIFYDKISDRYFHRYEREVMDAEYHLNRNFVLRGYATLNEFYVFLGLSETKRGDVLGWTASDGYCWVDFEHRPLKGDKGKTAYLIDMVFEPGEMEDYI